MSGICCWLRHKGKNVMFSDDEGLEKFSCCAIPLSRNKEIPKDVFLNYCINRNEECSRYRNIEKLGKTVEHVEKFFR